MSARELPQELAVFVQVLAEDEDLRAWFESFAEMPALRRSDEFLLLAERMKAAGEHPDLIQATKRIADSKVYEAVRIALAERALAK